MHRSDSLPQFICCHRKSLPAPRQKLLDRLPNIKNQYSTQLVETGDYSKFSSPKYLQGAQVQSCKKVILMKGKQSKAIPYYRRLQNQTPASSAFYTSWSQQIHRLHLSEHVGITNKLLVKYHPNAMRSRLLNSQEKSLVRNVSQLEIGDRQIPDSRHFLTTYKNHFTRKDQQEQVSHIGILSNRTIWQHRQQER